MKLTKSPHFFRQSSKKYLRLHQIISKNHYLPPLTPFSMLHIHVTKFIKNRPVTWSYQSMKLTKSPHFLRQSSKKYLRLHQIISKSHYLPPPYPLFNVAHPYNHVYQMWVLSSNPKQHFPTLREGERGSLRYFLDDCLK